jgi:hypothetical protein
VNARVYNIPASTCALDELVPPFKKMFFPFNFHSFLLKNSIHENKEIDSRRRNEINIRLALNDTRIQFAPHLYAKRMITSTTIEEEEDEATEQIVLLLHFS